MEKRFIALLDSGVGGISTLLELKKILPNENYIYLGDNKNAPYGEKSILKLKELLINNLTLLLHFNIKAVVVACNTLSVYLKDFIENFCGVKTFGVFPSVYKHIINKRKTLLLATPNTVRNYQSVKGLELLALPNLAMDIERNFESLEKVNVFNHLKTANFDFEDYDSVVLGCTHYFFVKNQIINHLKPRYLDCCSYYTAIKLKNYLTENKILENSSKNQTLFIGDSFDKNQNFFNKVVKEN